MEVVMEYLRLNNGVRMPMVGFGTWDIRGKKGKACILEALEVGYRLIDTAQMYDNEDIVGEAIKESGIDRKELFITTKLHQPWASYSKAKKGIERSLINLKTDYIDRLLIHEPYENALEMYQAFQKASQSGKVRAIGISNFNIAKYESFIQHCNILPAVNQVESHIYYPQFDLKAVMAQHGTQMQAWGSFTEGRKDIFKEALLIEIGAKYHKSAAQVALRYLVQNKVAVIPKSAHKDRMKENIDIFDFELSSEDMDQIRTFDTGSSLFGWY